MIRQISVPAVARVLVACFLSGMIAPVASNAATARVTFDFIDTNSLAQSADIVFQLRHNGGDPYNTPNADYLAVGASGTYAGHTVTGIDHGFNGPDNIVYATGFSDGGGVSWDFTGGAANLYYSTYLTDTLGSFNNSSTTNLTTTISGAPEPTTWAMFVAGFGGLGLLARRRRAAAASAA